MEKKMDLERAKTLLMSYRKRTVASQINRKAILLEAFEVFWKSKPSKEDFCKYTDGLYLFPEILFEILKKVM